MSAGVIIFCSLGPVLYFGSLHQYVNDSHAFGQTEVPHVGSGSVCVLIQSLCIHCINQ